VKLFNEKRSDLEEQQLHLNIGLQKIRETVEQVEELQKSLSIKRNELEEKNNLANAKLKQMVCYFVTLFMSVLLVIICDTGAQNPSYVDFDFIIQSYFTLRLLQSTFYRIKIYF